MPLPKKVKSTREAGIFLLEDGRYLLDFKPGGRWGTRVRKITSTYAQSKLEKASAIQQYKKDKRRTVSKTRPQNKLRLKDLVDLWFKFHGNTLASGQDRYDSLMRTVESLRNPLAAKADPTIFLTYREKRLKDGVSANYVNHELVYIKSVYNQLEKLELWDLEKPFDGIEKLRVPARDVFFLNVEQINKLLIAAEESRNSDLLVTIKICLATGARYGEALGLRRENVRDQRLHFIDTKNGRNRYVPISEGLEKEILSGRENLSQLFIPSWDAFDSAVDRAKIKLPKGQATHVLRHTFASHFMMNGGSLLVLNKVLGHETIEMTMVYAHLAPDHLSEALTKNPLENQSQSNVGTAKSITQVTNDFPSEIVWESSVGPMQWQNSP